MEKERILYPSYFNGALKRSEGRRVPQSLAQKGVLLGDLERAVKKSGLTGRTEQNPHPAFWARHEGRVVVPWGQSKEVLLRRVAAHLEVKR
jgi:signal recognition particle subunit SRP19